MATHKSFAKKNTANNSCRPYENCSRIKFQPTYRIDVPFLSSVYFA